MGVLADRLAEPTKTGAPLLWGRTVAGLPDDVVADILAGFLNPDVPVVRIKSAVEELFPDAPVRAETTWRNWSRLHRQGRLV